MRRALPRLMPRLVLVAAVGAIALVLLAKLEIDLWSECRSDHSFLYCMRVMGR